MPPRLSRRRWPAARRRPHGPAKRDRAGSRRRPASVASKAAVYVLDESGCGKVRDWCKHQRLHQRGHQALTAHRARGLLPRRVTTSGLWSMSSGRRGELRLPREVVQLSMMHCATPPGSGRVKLHDHRTWWGRDTYVQRNERIFAPVCAIAGRRVPNLSVVTRPLVEERNTTAEVYCRGWARQT